MLKKMPGLDKSKEDSRSITTIQGRGGKEKTPNSNGAQVRDLISELKETGSQIDIRRYCINQGTTSYPPTTNSAQYGASQNAAWQQHGSRSDSIKKNCSLHSMLLAGTLDTLDQLGRATMDSGATQATHHHPLKRHQNRVLYAAGCIP